jgi:ATP-dependent Clp protease protease subunit
MGYDRPPRYSPRHVIRPPRHSAEAGRPARVGNGALRGHLQPSLRNRIVFLGSEVNDEVANFLTAQLLYLEGEDPEKDIWLYINSPGGSVTAGMAIYDTMQFVNPDVGTICMGLGASMGQFLLCAGAPGKRYGLRHARIMMHQPSAGMAGQAADIAIQAEQMKYIKDLLAERIAEHTGQTKEQVNADSDRDRWFTADQAKEYGILDHVIHHRGEIPQSLPDSKPG